MPVNHTMHSFRSWPSYGRDFPGATSSTMKMRTITVLFCALAVCLIISSCRKSNERLCLPIRECEPVPSYDNDGIEYRWDQSIEGSYIHSPSFNPNNDDEFVFLAGDDAGST